MCRAGRCAVNSFTVLALIAIFLIAPLTWFAINAMRPIFLLPILAPFAWVNIEYYGYLQRAGASYDFKNTIDMLIMMTPIGFMLWGAFCGMPLRPWERAMVRSLDRGAGYLTVLRFAFGVWPGLKRSSVQAVISVVLMYASQVIHGLSLVVVAAVVLMAAKDRSSRPFEVNKPIDDLIVPTFLTLLAVAVSLLLSAGLRSLGRWVSRQSFERQVGRDQRSPILFLRAFKDDQATLPPGRLFQRLLRAELGRRRLDHVLVEEFSRFGPIVALGRPGERPIRPFGAARVYVVHSDWQVRSTIWPSSPRTSCWLSTRAPAWHGRSRQCWSRHCVRKPFFSSRSRSRTCVRAVSFARSSLMSNLRIVAPSERFRASAAP